MTITEKGGMSDEIRTDVIIVNKSPFSCGTLGPDPAHFGHFVKNSSLVP